MDSGHRYRRWVRAGGDVAELTGLVDLTRWPAGMRVIVRHQRPHPRAQLSISEECDGYRYQAFVENTSIGRIRDVRNAVQARGRKPIRQ